MYEYLIKFLIFFKKKSTIFLPIKYFQHYNLNIQIYFNHFIITNIALSSAGIVWRVFVTYCIILGTFQNIILGKKYRYIVNFKDLSRAIRILLTGSVKVIINTLFVSFKSFDEK